jgi:hypothetical protein
MEFEEKCDEIGKQKGGNVERSDRSKVGYLWA